MAILIFIVFAAIAVLGSLPVIGFALALRRWLIRRASLAVALAVSHAIIIAIAIALYPTPIFWSSVHEFDDIYWIFMLIPGVHIYQIGRLIGFAVGPSLETVMSFHSASVLVLVIIPGIFCLLLGSLQWYLLGRIWQWLWPNQSPEPTAVGAVRSAVAVHVASRRWLSFHR